MPGQLSDGFAATLKLAVCVRQPWKSRKCGADLRLLFDFRCIGLPACGPEPVQRMVLSSGHPPKLGSETGRGASLPFKLTKVELSNCAVTMNRLGAEPT